MLVEIFEDVGLHLGLRRADKEHLDAVELGKQISKRSRGAAAIQLTNESDAQAIEWPLAMNRIEIKQRLGGMLPAIAVAGVNHWHRRDLGGPFRAAFLM